MRARQIEWLAIIGVELSQRDNSSNSTISPSGEHGHWRAIACRAKAYFCSAAATTAIEYGLIVGGIAVAILTIVFQLGDELETFFNYITNNVFRRK